MSGIAALFHPQSRPASPGVVVETAAALDPWGREEGRWWIDGPVALVHSRSATRPAGVPSPTLLDAGDLVVATNARVDNRGDLRSELGLDATADDAALVAEAYRRWGPDGVGRLVGPFALALYDRAARRLVLARDALGVRPLYYAHAPDRTLAAASDLRALRALAPDAFDEVDDDHVADYLGGVLSDRERTFYADVHRLPPATVLVADGRGVRRWRYWTPDPERELRLGSDDDYAEGFRERFLEAVRCRLEDGADVGLLLSGGLDSSLVGGAMRHYGAPVHAFSATFEALPAPLRRASDERRYVEALTEGGGLRAHAVPAEPLRPLAVAAAALARDEPPTVLRNGYLTSALYGEAAGAGVRVVLDGLEGDLTVSHGYDRLSELAAAGAWEAFAVEERALVDRLRADPARLFAAYGWPHLIRGGPAAWRLGYSHGVRPALLRLRRPPRGIVSRSLSRRTDYLDRRHGWERALSAAYPTERQAHAAALETGFSAAGLEALARDAAPLGVEPRHPFYDRRLIEYCLSLPADQKLRDGWTRYVARRAGRGLAPDSILWRPGKATLSPNFRLRLLKEERAGALELLADAPDVLSSYVDLARARALFLRGDVEPVWPALLLALWLRRQAGLPWPDPIAASVSLSLTTTP